MGDNFFDVSFVSESNYKVGFVHNKEFQAWAQFQVTSLKVSQHSRRGPHNDVRDLKSPPLFKTVRSVCIVLESNEKQGFQLTCPTNRGLWSSSDLVRSDTSTERTTRPQLDVSSWKITWTRLTTVAPSELQKRLIMPALIMKPLNQSVGF